MHRSQVSVVYVGRHTALEEVHTQILITFPFGVPQHRGLDRLYVVRLDGINLAFTFQLITGLIDPPRLAQLQTEQWFHNSKQHLPLPLSS
jgi:hypothetical protein